MFNINKVELKWGNEKLVLETGLVARQADGAIIATLGDTKVLATVVSAKTAIAEQNFFPLTVNYQEKTYAAGKIPGGYFKREGRPSENETLVSRLIDRPIRPLFPNGYKNETQVIVTVLQHDGRINPDILSIIAASAALTISGAPFMGPIAGARVGYINNEYVLNPYIDQMEKSSLDLIVAGTSEAVLMVESEAQELDEKTMLDAVMFGQNAFQPVIEAIIELAEQAAKSPIEFHAQEYDDLYNKIKNLVQEDLKTAYTIVDKQQRYLAIDSIKAKIAEAITTDESKELYSSELISETFKKLQAHIVRTNILEKSTRIDGRGLGDIRAINSQIGILPRSHGSALFTRGETQALVVATLGTAEDEQYVDALTGMYKEAFMLHYNFPPFSVGEIGRIGSPGRREIGHGKLAWRAIHPLLPAKDKFPYTIRAVSEITESNGSSSMATVCGTSLALMDAGVPLKRPIAGIAMGLIKEGSKFAVLSDILGDEDHLGDMDFKVAGTEKGITSLQMDIKIDGITKEIMEIALNQAKEGRFHILGEMSKTIDIPREDVGEFAPRIESMQIPIDKIRDVIGTGGKIIREIVEQTGAKINIEDDGTVNIAAADSKAIKAAHQWIHSIVAEPEVNKIYNGTIVKTTDFGAFVNFFGNRDGLVHISQLSNKRVENTTDVVKEGQKVWVKLLGSDNRGKVKLSMKVVDQGTGVEIISNEFSSDDDETDMPRKQPRKRNVKRDR